MKVITAPNDYKVENTDTLIFLAGGITNCYNWQEKVIEALSEKPDTENMVIFNPRRENFPIGDTSKAYEQIAWEFQWLEKMDIFSMYFVDGESDQPICMYELGRNILKMQIKFPCDWKDRIVISCERGYKRSYDVIQQTYFATSNYMANSHQVVPEYCLQDHAEYIYRAYKKLKYV